jgi:hypothetical protein
VIFEFNTPVMVSLIATPPSNKFLESRHLVLQFEFEIGPYLVERQCAMEYALDGCLYGPRKMLGSE